MPTLKLKAWTDAETGFFVVARGNISTFEQTASPLPPPKTLFCFRLVDRPIVQNPFRRFFGSSRGASAQYAFKRHEPLLR